MRLKIIRQIIKHLEDLQSTSDWAHSNSQVFEYLIDEWLCHKNNDAFERSKNIALSCWQKNSGWKEFLEQMSSKNLFAYGNEELWFHFADKMSRSENNPLHICDEMIDWVAEISKPITDNMKLRAQAAQPCASYEREVIGVLPYSEGVMTVACFRFPHSYLTLPHYHPEIVVERILQGTLSEVVFNKSSDSSYTFSKIERYTPEKKLKAQTTCGHPHMVTGDESDVISVAIFAGKNPIRILKPEHISNPDKLKVAIESLTQKSERNHLEKFLAV